MKRLSYRQPWHKLGTGQRVRITGRETIPTLHTVRFYSGLVQRGLERGKAGHQARYLMAKIEHKFPKLGTALARARHAVIESQGE
jgi:hypothetical protein